MKTEVLPSVEDVWRQRCAALVEALGETIDQLNDLLRLDEYHRHGHDPDQLNRALGPLAETHLDVGSLSRVLGRSTRSRAMAPERRSRVEALIPRLEGLKSGWSEAGLDAAHVDIDRPEDEILARAEAHFDRLAQVFRAERMAQLEIRSKYDSRIHDPAFADFDWRQLGPGELRLCPPFLVVAPVDGGAGSRLIKMMRLLDTGMPIKVLALRSSFSDPQPGASGTLVPAKMTTEMLPLAMRGVYFVQTLAGATLREEMAHALASPRPAVISVLCRQDGESQGAFESRAERAVRGRAFPRCVYDPDRDERFTNCLDVSFNPSPEAVWATETLKTLDSDGQPTEVEEAFTFAHFAASDPELATELADALPTADALVPLLEFLGLSRQQRLGKAPVISVAASDGTVVRKVVGPQIVQACAERRHLWRTLQEISGIDNPHVRTTRAALQQELDAQRDAQLETLREELEQKARERERTAVTNAVRRLVSRLAGTDVNP